MERRKAIQKRRTHKERCLRATHIFNGGPWTKEEKHDFLRGLRQFGPGKWKKIQTILKTRCVFLFWAIAEFSWLPSPTTSCLFTSPACNRRSSIQIKSHGQKILRRLKDGEDIYSDLERAETAGEILSTPTTTSMKTSTQFDLDDGDGDEDENDSYSTTSTTISTSISSFYREESNGTDELALLECSGETDQQVVQPQNNHNLVSMLRDPPQFTTAIAINFDSTVSTDKAFLDTNIGIITQGQSQLVSTLSLDEATAVLALCNMTKLSNKNAGPASAMP